LKKSEDSRTTQAVRRQTMIRHTFLTIYIPVPDSGSCGSLTVHTSQVEMSK
jgi:hypothetical protein